MHLMLAGGMGGSAHLSYAVGSILIGGGVYAFLKVKSVPSLVAGLGVGSVLVISGFMIQKGKDFEVRDHAAHFLRTKMVAQS
jgi:uncharacterized membrane protein (UPF0136 family)